MSSDISPLWEQKNIWTFFISKVNKIHFYRETTPPFFPLSPFQLSCPSRWTFIAVNHIYEWTGWFLHSFSPSLMKKRCLAVEFNTPNGCCEKHASPSSYKGCYHWYHFLFLYFSINARESEAKFSACSRIISDRSPSSPNFSPLSMKFYDKKKRRQLESNPIIKKQMWNFL